ncbi:hypothetical protein B4135_0444 [Caldibacillus debilis]|uniref:Uncharacterized protein n=1 Tax=Caldibacillus debilis TaxID=301148 RepID=A0A150LAK4_9BACI|nr:hypothetical protein B4135_0444 [Caldibacillus debilis]
MSFSYPFKEKNDCKNVKKKPAYQIFPGIVTILSKMRLKKPIR